MNSKMRTNSQLTTEPKKSKQKQTKQTIRTINDRYKINREVKNSIENGDAKELNAQPMDMN